MLALLFIEGKAVDYNFLGVRLQYQLSKSLITLPLTAEFTRDFSVIKEIVNKYHTSFGNLQSKSSPETNPLFQSADENMRSVVSTQKELLNLFEKRGLLNQSLNNNGRLERQPDKSANPQLQERIRKGIIFEESVRISLEDHPYLLDHSIIRQPANWKYQEDLNPVVPMTMTLELFAEVARRQDPSRKIVKLGPALAMKWIAAENDFENTITGVWKDENKMALEIKGYASCEITTSDTYAAPPSEYEGNIDIGKEIMPPLTIEEVYGKYTFHGPAYQSATQIIKVAERGIAGLCEKKEGKGSLLDNFGQSLGLFLHLTEKENRISFPVRIKEICFYQDFEDQEGVFEQTLIVKSVKPDYTIGDIVLKRDGKIWAVAKAWYSQRFEFDETIWNIILKPQQNKLAKQLAPHVFYYDNAYSKMVSWMFLYKRYLNYPEKQYFDSLDSPDKQKEFLISRIAVKDAVREFIRKNEEVYRYYPIEIFLRKNEAGKPFVEGSEELEKTHISLAHKGKESVAVASAKPVGIDMEQIRERDASFMNHSFTEKELKLLDEKDVPEWSTRFWVAKEAYSKMLGTGLQGNPKRYEIEKIEEETLFIKNTPVRTLRHKEDYIVGWTL